MVFLTGATGFLGAHIFLELIKETTFDIGLLIRAENEEAAWLRLEDVVVRLSGNRNVLIENRNRISIVNARLQDFSSVVQLKFGSRRFNSISNFIHCAAATSFRLAKDQAFDENVLGTKAVIGFCNELKDLKKFVYVGTTFIAGDYCGDFSENDFNLSQGFGNNYEWSKFESEKLVRDNFNYSYSTLVCRPSVVMGAYKSGWVDKFKMIYEPLRMFSKEIFSVVPAKYETIHNFIPVDLGAKVICLLMENECGNKVFHVVHPQNIVSGEFLDLCAQYFNYKNPLFVAANKFNMGQLSPVQAKLIDVFIHYFNYQAVFKSDITQKVLAKAGFEYPALDSAYFCRIFKFMESRNYICKKTIKHSLK